MAYIGGTSLANKFISKYSSSGHLLDLYSDAWISKNKDFDGMSIADFKKYDAKFGTDYRNHILLISTDWYEDSESNFSEDLAQVFPKYKNQLRNYSDHVYFDPNFVLINLATKQMLAVGLGRNNRCFMNDVSSNSSVFMNLPNDLSAQAVFGKKDKTYFSDFLRLDHAGIVYKFLFTLNEIGPLVYTRDSECTPALYDELLMAEPDEDGVYEVYGDTFSEEDRNELIKVYEKLNQKVIIHEEFLMRFFPNLDFGSLNDY